MLTQGRCLAQPAAGPSGSGGCRLLAAAQVLALPGQEAHGKAVRQQHHAQRNVEAHYGADQLVHRIRYLAGTIHQHRGVILESMREQITEEYCLYCLGKELQLT